MSLIDILCLILKSDKIYEDSYKSAFVQKLNVTNNWNIFKTPDIKFINLSFVVPLENSPVIHIYTVDNLSKTIEENAKSYLIKNIKYIKSQSELIIPQYILDISSIDIENTDIREDILT